MNPPACRICGTPITFDGDWPCCACDQAPRLTLTVTQAASFLYMSRGNVYDLIATGYLAAIRTGRPIRLRMTAIKNYLAGEHAGWRQTHQEANRP